MSREFNLKQKLTAYLDNGVKSFKYDVTSIDFVNRMVYVTDEAGRPCSFSFAMIEGLGGIDSDEPSVAPDRDPPVDDKPINLDDIPF